MTKQGKWWRGCYTYAQPKNNLTELAPIFMGITLHQQPEPAC